MSEKEDEILKTVNALWHAFYSLPAQVADKVADRLKNEAVSLPVRPSGPVLPPPLIKMAVAVPASPSGEVASVRADLAEITQQRDKAQIDLDVIVAALRKSEQELEGLREASQAAQTEYGTAQAEAAQLRTTAEALRQELEDLASQKQRFEADLMSARELQEEAKLLQQQREAVEAKLAALEARRTEFEGYQKAGEKAHLLLEHFWPEWLKTGDLQPWKARIEAGVFESSSLPSFGLLFAAIHGYNAALRDVDPKTLHDSLREVGRRLYAWLRDLGESDASAAGVAELWAQAVNGDCAGRGEVEVPIPGHAANNQWMLFQPRGGSSPDVASVRSWCVRDAQKRPVHRAEVTV